VGAELVRLLSQHPGVELGPVCARSAVGQRLADHFPHLAGLGELRFDAFEPERLASEVQLAFLALPHAASAQAAEPLLSAGLKVVDLSADFRLRSEALYQAHYGPPPHPCPERLEKAVYALPEFSKARREAIAGAQLLACPGCYPTATLLAALPLVELGLVRGPVIADCKSGVSGAGRSPKQSSLFCESGEQIAPYAVGSHRHSPEIAQELSLAAGSELGLIFTPHLTPMARGILATVYLELNDAGIAQAARAGGLQELYEQRYHGEAFVSVLPTGRFPGTGAVRGSNAAQISIVHHAESQRAIAMAAIDNLGKGAAGQAIQVMNINLGLPERTGLSNLGVFP